MSSNRTLICDVSRQSVCMGDDVDAMHEMFVVIDCAGVDDMALHCIEHVLARKYLPSQDGHMSWIAEANGLPFAVIVRAPDGNVNVIPAGLRVAIENERLSLFFSYHLQQDPGRLLAEIQAGRRPRQ